MVTSKELFKQREKRKQELLQQGMSMKQATAQYRQEREQVLGVKTEQQKRAEAETSAQKQATETQKKKELAAVPIPRAEDLSVTNQPVVGELGQSASGFTTAYSQAKSGQYILKDLQDNPELQVDLAKLNKYMLKNKLTPEQTTDDLELQTLLKLKLNERDIDILKEGKADVSNLASTAEGLPIVSSVTKFTGGALTPTSAYAKISDLRKSVSTLYSSMEGWTESINKNPENADQYSDLVDEAEQELLNAQSRIKLLVIQSPILQNSPEEVETIQKELDKALIKSAKIRSQIIQTKYGAAI